MEELKNVPRYGKWSDCVDNINENFSNLKSNILELEMDSSKSKGLYPTAEVLREMIPTSETGAWAYVGTGFPATIYIWNGTSWVSTSKKAGDFDVTGYASSVETTSASLPDLFKTTLGWIYTNDNGTTWNTVIDTGIIKISRAASPSYIIRPRSLVYGDQGELLEDTITDAYLKKFITGASFVKCIIESPQVTNTYTSGSLSWTIDKEYYKYIVDGIQTKRNPVAGDTFAATFYYRNLDGEQKSARKTFKFIV